MFAPLLWNVYDSTMNNNPRTNNLCEGWNNMFFSTLSATTTNQVRSGQVRSECLTCTFRASCCSAGLSRAQVPAFACSSARDRNYHQSTWRVIEWFQRELTSVDTVNQQGAVGNPTQRQVRRRYSQLLVRLRNLCVDRVENRKTLAECLHGIGWNIRLNHQH